MNKKKLSKIENRKKTTTISLKVINHPKYWTFIYSAYYRSIITNT